MLQSRKIAGSIVDEVNKSIIFSIVYLFNNLIISLFVRLMSLFI
jgi:hypothetical protein